MQCIYLCTDLFAREYINTVSVLRKPMLCHSLELRAVYNVYTGLMDCIGEENSSLAGVIYNIRRIEIEQWEVFFL